VKKVRSGFGFVTKGELLAGPLSPWKTFTQNCSTVVAKALTIGGGDNLAGAFSNWSDVWRPHTVKSYCGSDCLST
jgi:hypothetical protein